MPRGVYPRKKKEQVAAEGTTVAPTNETVVVHRHKRRRPAGGWHKRPTMSGKILVIIDPDTGKSEIYEPAKKEKT